MVVTEKRFVVKARAYNQIDIDLPVADPLFRQVSFAKEANLMLLRFDASILA